MGEVYLHVDVEQLWHEAVALRGQVATLHDAGVALAGLSAALDATAAATPGGPAPHRPSAELRAAAARAERDHGALLGEIRVRLDEVVSAMAHAATAYAHHEQRQSHVLLKAV